MAVPNRFDTHEVTNQAPPLADIDLFALDPALQDAVRANGAGGEVKALSEQLAEGELLVIENVRFEPGESKNDAEFARADATPDKIIAVATGVAA